MFNKLKQFKELRNQAKTIQNALADEAIVVEKKGIKLEMDGNFKVKSLSIPKDIPQEKIEELLRDCLNDAIGKAQRVAATKIQSMGGLPGLG